VCGGRKRGQQIQALGRSKGGFSTKIHLSTEALGNPLEVILTPGEASDCPMMPRLIEGRKAQHVLADKGYDSDDNRMQIKAAGAAPCIPSKANRSQKQPCDYDLYEERHQIEGTFSKLKYFRRIFSRFDKYAAHFLSFIHFAATILWLK
jgi:transposase